MGTGSRRELIADGQEPADIFAFQGGGEAQANEPKRRAAKNCQDQTRVAGYGSRDGDHAGRHDRAGQQDAAAVEEFEVEAVGSPGVDPDSQRREALGGSMAMAAPLAPCLPTSRKSKPMSTTPQTHPQKIRNPCLSVV